MSIQNFDWETFNVGPFCLNRELESWQNFCFVFIVSKDHPKYNDLKNRIIDLLKSFSTQSSFTLNFDKEWQVPNQKNVYTLDLRKSRDETFTNLLKIVAEDDLEKWEMEEISEQIYANSRGIVVFADEISQVPQYLLTMSQVGLSETSNLKEFFEKAAGYYTNSTEIQSQDEKTLAGFIKMLKWKRFISF